MIKENLKSPIYYQQWSKIDSQTDIVSREIQLKCQMEIYFPIINIFNSNNRIIVNAMFDHLGIGVERVII